MYPREITTTPLWIRHKLPLSPPSPPHGDEKLRNQIRSQNGQSTDEVIEHYVRQERARLDLKWCLDEFFAWNISNPFVGQLITANIFGRVHLAYIIDIKPVNVLVAPVDMFGDSVVIGFDDIYLAEDSPFYENYLLKHHFLHSQHVLDYIANQKLQHELMQFSHKISFDMVLVESIGENFENQWPEGEETWFIQDALPQRCRFVTCKHEVMPITSAFNTIDDPMQNMLFDGNYVASSLTQQSNEIILLLQQNIAKQDALLNQNKLLKEEIARQNVIINELVLTVETIERNRILHEVKLSQETTIPTWQPASHLVVNTVPDLEEPNVKQLQFQQIDQLIKYPLFSESYSQYVSNGIDEFYYECGHSNARTFSLKSTTISSSDSFNSCFIQLVSSGIILITFIFVSMAFGNLGPYLICYNDKNTPYSVSNLVFHAINNFDWFRTLAVP